MSTNTEPALPVFDSDAVHEFTLTDLKHTITVTGVGPEGATEAMRQLTNRYLVAALGSATDEATTDSSLEFAITVLNRYVEIFVAESAVKDRLEQKDVEALDALRAHLEDLTTWLHRAEFVWDFLMDAGSTLDPATPVPDFSQERVDFLFPAQKPRNAVHLLFALLSNLSGYEFRIDGAQCTVSPRS